MKNLNLLAASLSLLLLISCQSGPQANTSSSEELSHIDSSAIEIAEVLSEPIVDSEPKPEAEVRNEPPRVLPNRPRGSGVAKQIDDPFEEGAVSHKGEDFQIEHQGLRMLKELDKASPTITYIPAETGGQVEGRSGSKVKIPSNAFVRSDGKAVAGQVKVVVDEYLTVSRAIQNGLTTMSGSHLLETGGMLRITAEDREGNELELAEDKEIELRIPTRDLKRGMQTFTGYRKNGKIDWLPQDNEIAERYGFNQRDMSLVYRGKYVRKPSFPGGQRALSVFLSKFLEYPSDAARKGITGSCTFKFRVSAGGETQNIQLIGDPFPSFARKARRLLSRMHFYPAFSKDGNFVKSDYIRITFFFQPESVTDRDYKWEDFREEYENFKEEGIIADDFYRGILKEIEAKMDSLGTTKVGMRNRDDRGVMYNVLSSRRLGWINCDRYVNSNLPLANVVLDVDAPKDKAFFLVLKESRSIMSGDRYCNGVRICFPNLPVGYTYKVIGVEKKDDTPYLVEHEGVIAADGTPVRLNLKEVATEDIQAALSKLNYFQGDPI